MNHDIPAHPQSLMRTSTPLAAFALALALAVASPAQDAVRAGAARALDPEPPIEAAALPIDGATASDWMVPIHTAAADPVLGEYGLWAAGPGYKVSFHDGISFYPCLGRDYPENLPLRWRTESVSVGGVALPEAAGGARVWHDAWRFELRRPGITEVYDVRKGGVEQSFVVQERPARNGDLLIEGRVDTALRAEPCAERHGRLVFRDDRGTPIVEYGAAFVVDAAGRRAAIPTGFDGTSIRLRVQEEWLRDATFPITVDPLTSPVVIAGEVNHGRVLDSDTATTFLWARGQSRRVMIVHSRYFSATDVDAFGKVLDPDLSNGVRVWAEITTGWSTIRPRVAYSSPSDVWVVASERATATTSTIIVYKHGRRDPTLNGGVWRSLAPPSGVLYHRPDIGGGNSAVRSLVVFEQQSPGSPTTARVRGVYYDPDSVNPSFSATFPLATTTNNFFEQRNPSVGVVNGNMVNGAWFAAWQSRSRLSSTDAWDIELARIGDDGQGRIGNPVVVGHSAQGTWDKQYPQVDGNYDAALVAYHLYDTQRQAYAIGYQVVDWPAAASAPTLGPLRTLGWTARTRIPTLHGVAEDIIARQMWALVYSTGTEVHALRLGSTGGILEDALVHQQSLGVDAASVAHSYELEDYIVAYADRDFLSPLRARRLRPSPLAQVSQIGTSCGPVTMRAHARPWAGNGNFDLLIEGGTPGQAVVVLAGVLAGAPLPIPGTACLLHLDPATAFTAAQVVFPPPVYQLLVPMPLPDDPVFRGIVDFQCVYLSPGANPLGVLLTNALRVRVD